MTIAAAKLRHRVTLQQQSIARNSYGEATTTWVTYATVWAAIEPLRGHELLLAQQVNESDAVKITIRHNKHVAHEHRIVYDGRNFEINSAINPDERNEYLELICTEIK